MQCGTKLYFGGTLPNWKRRNAIRSTFWRKLSIWFYWPLRRRVSALKNSIRKMLKTFSAWPISIGVSVCVFERRARNKEERGMRRKRNHFGARSCSCTAECIHAHIFVAHNSKAPLCFGFLLHGWRLFSSSVDFVLVRSSQRLRRFVLFCIPWKWSKLRCVKRSKRKILEQLESDSEDDNYHYFCRTGTMRRRKMDFNEQDVGMGTLQVSSSSLNHIEPIRNGCEKVQNRPHKRATDHPKMALWCHCLLRTQSARSTVWPSSHL